MFDHYNLFSNEKPNQLTGLFVDLRVLDAQPAEDGERLECVDVILTERHSIFLQDTQNNNLISLGNTKNKIKIVKITKIISAVTSLHV